jgi:glycosyltransferase involved in cell wall biosynthesis
LRKIRIALCGTRGIPANYGGFETAVDEISQRFIQHGYSVDVFCRLSHSGKQFEEDGGRRLIYVRGTAKPWLETFVSSIQTGFYLASHRREYKHAFWFNNANFPGILMTLLAGIPLTVNTDGLEWRRKKWRWPFKLYYFLTSFLISQLCSSLISDSITIQNFYQDKFWKKTHFIPYGVPSKVSFGDDEEEILAEYGIIRGKYFLQITRLEPDNLPLEAVRGFIKSELHKKGFELVIIGFKDKTPYALKLKKLSGSKGIHVLNAIYDPKILYTLRSNCYSYVHGNSVGGTNPALLEAMAVCPRIMVIDIDFSHELLGDLGVFFESAGIDRGFVKCVDSPDIRNLLCRRVSENYQWDAVSRSYLALVNGVKSNYQLLID